MKPEKKKNSVQYIPPKYQESKNGRLARFFEGFTIRPHIWSKQFAPKPLHVENRILGDYEIIYMSRGEGLFLLPDEEVRVHSGEFILIPPYLKHSIFSLPDQPFNNYWIHFDILPVYRQPLFNKHWDCESGCVKKPPWDFSELFEHSFGFIHNSGTAGGPVMESILKLLFSVTFCPASSVMNTLLPKKNKLLDRCIDRIRDGLQEELSIDIICTDCGVGRTTLFDLFKTELGCSPGDFIQTCRLRNVEHLLKTTALSISECAHLSGFPSVPGFFTLFKRKYGKTPLRYREEHYG